MRLGYVRHIHVCVGHCDGDDDEDSDQNTETGFQITGAGISVTVRGILTCHTHVVQGRGELAQSARRMN